MEYLAKLSPLLIIPFWLITLRFLSWVSGWRDLAETYATKEKFRGETFLHMQSAYLGKIRFKGTLNIGADEKGLYLVPIMLFRFFHQPLFIPWSKIRFEPFSSLFTSGHKLHIVSHDLAFSFYKNTLEKISKHLPKGRGYEKE